MALDTGEELLAAALGPDAELATIARSIDPLIVPYDQLARVDGWVIWCGHPPVPGDVPLLPIPDHLLWDDPRVALAIAAAIAADYAARRGAADAASLTRTLQRESPLAILTPDAMSPNLRGLIDDLARIGVPIVSDVEAFMSDGHVIESRRRRHAGHQAGMERKHDPALSFQQFVTADRIGGRANSSFVLHNEGERDGIAIDGELGDRFSIEIGLRETGLNDDDLIALEREAAEMPSFLNGVACRFDNGALELGWRIDAKPSAAEIGTVLHTWLTALFEVSPVDVRIVAAPSGVASMTLADMRANASRIRAARAPASILSPSPDETEAGA